MSRIFLKENRKMLITWSIPAILSLSLIITMLLATLGIERELMGKIVDYIVAPTFGSILIATMFTIQ
jgi:hypothetical protein